jgi:hypothetical protein
VRYSLHETRENKYFKHGIQVFKILDFHATRVWLSSTYGFASTLANDILNNEHWTFHLVYQTYMIYLKGDEELAWFKLKFGEAEYEPW